MSAANKRTARTVLQSAVGITVALPGIIDAPGVPETLPWVGGALAVAGGFARVMALPSVEALLDRFGIGLVEDGSENAR